MIYVFTIITSTWEKALFIWWKNKLLLPLCKQQIIEIEGQCCLNVSTCEFFKVNQKLYFYLKFVVFLCHKVVKNGVKRLLLVKCYDKKMFKLPWGSSCRSSSMQLTNKKNWDRNHCNLGIVSRQNKKSESCITYL